jgi:uncharacterized membrane protein YfcA
MQSSNPWTASRRGWLTAIALTAMTVIVVALGIVLGPGIARDILKAFFFLLVAYMVVRVWMARGDRLRRGWDDN